jgi:hypothetical protein
VAGRQTAYRGELVGAIIGVCFLSKLLSRWPTWRGKIHHIYDASALKGKLEHPEHFREGQRTIQEEGGLAYYLRQCVSTLKLYAATYHPLWQRSHLKLKGAPIAVLLNDIADSMAKLGADSFSKRWHGYTVEFDETDLVLLTPDDQIVTDLGSYMKDRSFTTIRDEHLESPGKQIERTPGIHKISNTLMENPITPYFWLIAAIAVRNDLYFPRKEDGDCCPFCPSGNPGYRHLAVECPATRKPREKLHRSLELSVHNATRGRARMRLYDDSNRPPRSPDIWIGIRGSLPKTTMATLRRLIHPEWTARFTPTNQEQTVHGDLLLAQELQYYIAWYCQHLQFIISPRGRDSSDEMRDLTPPTHNATSVKRSLGRADTTTPELISSSTFRDTYL